MSGKCGMRYDRATGERYYLPQCWGGLYHISGCYCASQDSSASDLEAAVDRIAALEAKIDKLVAHLTP